VVCWRLVQVRAYRSLDHRAGLNQQGPPDLNRVLPALQTAAEAPQPTTVGSYSAAAPFSHPKCCRSLAARAPSDRAPNPPVGGGDVCQVSQRRGGAFNSQLGVQESGYIDVYQVSQRRGGAFNSQPGVQESGYICMEHRRLTGSEPRR